MSFLLWITGYILSVGDDSTISAALGLDFIGDTVSRVVSLLSYIGAALILNHISLFEYRVPYLPHIFLWLASVQMFLQTDCLVAFSLLLFLLAVVQLISCCQPHSQEKTIYGAFAILSFSSLFFLQFAYLLPLFFLYLWVGNVFSIKNLFAALLGVITPYWLLFGTLFVAPSLEGLLLPLKSGVSNLLSSASFSFSLQSWVTLATEILILFVAVSLFFISSLPAKPLLRRRMILVFILNAYLLLLSFFIPQDYIQFLAWRIPGDAIMAVYVFSTKITRLSNIYFITLNILWLLTAVLCLWII